MCLDIYIIQSDLQVTVPVGLHDYCVATITVMYTVIFPPLAHNDNHGTGWLSDKEKCS